jgi:hypothetical protein
MSDESFWSKITRKRHECECIEKKLEECRSELRKSKEQYALEHTNIRKVLKYIDETIERSYNKLRPNYIDIVQLEELRRKILSSEFVD